MPLDFERIILNAIPDGEMPVFHASQFETMRPFIADLKWGIEDFPPGEGCWCTLSIRKTDDTLVIIDDIDIDNNTISCILTQQSVACIGDNFCQVKVWATEYDEDKCIACLNFILHVQPDPEAGGLTSESEINNLTEQIETITHEVIGEDYYDKTEVDNLISGVEAQIPTSTSDLTNDSGFITSAALTPYAKTADLATVATTGDYDDLLNKPVIPDAQIQSDWEQADNTKVDYIKNKPDIAAMIANALFEVMPVGTESGPIASFDTEVAAPLVNVSCDIVATGGNGTPDNPNPINGYSSANITRCGVNLWDEDWELGTFNWVTGEKTPSTTRIRNVNLIKVKPNTTYFLKSDNAIEILYYRADKSYISTTSKDNTTFTTPNDCAWININDTTTATYNENISINYPATDTTYHAYNGQTYTIAFGQTVYGGVLDVTRGKLRVTHEIVVFDGTENYQNDWFPSVVCNQVIPVGSGSGVDIISSHCPSQNTWINYANAFKNTIVFNRADTNWGVTSATELKNLIAQWYSNGEPLQIVYPLATPFDIDLTPEVISAIVGTNNVYSDTNGDTTVQYKDSIQHYIDTRI